MRTNHFTRQLTISVVVALLLPILFGAIAFQVLGDNLQFNVDGVQDQNGLAWGLGVLSTGPGLALFGLAFVAFLLAAMLPTMLMKNNGSVVEDAEPDANDTRETGTVKWFNVSKGFGFITRDAGDDIFVHFRSIRGQGHRSLRQGQRVRFAVREGDKGLQAEDVSIIAG